MKKRKRAPDTHEQASQGYKARTRNVTQAATVRMCHSAGSHWPAVAGNVDYYQQQWGVTLVIPDGPAVSA